MLAEKSFIERMLFFLKSRKRDLWRRLMAGDEK